LIATLCSYKEFVKDEARKGHHLRQSTDGLDTGAVSAGEFVSDCLIGGRPVPRSHLTNAFVAVPLLVGIAIFSSAPATWSQTAGAGGATPTAPRLQAELLKTIDASQAKVGDEVTARTVTSLEFDGTKFPTGATVTGHVAEVDPGRLVLLFDHIAVKKKAPVPLGLSLRAVMMPQSGPNATGDQVSPRAQGLGANPGNPASPVGAGGPMRSPEAAAQDSAVTVFRGPSSVETGNGGVIGLPGLQLGVSDDPKVGANFKVAKDHKLLLEKGLQLMFVVSK